MQKLFTIKVGCNDTTNDSPVSLIDTENGLFFDIPALSQRIKVSAKVDSDIINDASFKVTQAEKSFDTTNEVATCGYDLPTTVRLINNNKTMNPIFMNTNYETKSVITYLGVGSRYRILRYYSNQKIALTFHKTGEFQGCMILLREPKDEESTNLIKIDVKDKAKNVTQRYKSIFINLKRDADGNTYLETQVKPVSEKSMPKVKEIAQKYRNSMNFKVRTHPGEFLTKTYIMSEATDLDDDFMSEVDERLKAIKNKEACIIPNEYMDDNEKIIEMLTPSITDQGVRAVTILGEDLRLAPEVIKALRLIYVFQYNYDNNTLICRKSN